MIWTYPHQVIGVTDGPNFSVDGPGLIFIGKGKQPFDIVDLRDQSCKSTIKAISRDGISFEVDITVAFRVDSEVWTKEQHQELRRQNTLLREGKELDKNLNGTFPYSQARARSVLSYRSRKTTADDGQETERWNDHVLGMAEQAAREVLAERSIEDLWKARENENSSAAEEIANEIKAVIKDALRAHGIELINAKAAKFSFKDGNMDEKVKDEVSEQQLATWSIEWERQRSMTLANGQAESERLQQEARAYAHSILLTAIAEGLQQARAIHKNLPRYVIAMRFIGALEEMIEQQPETDEKEKLKARKNIGNAKAHFISNSRGE
jgi:regulator of protease activity HflC (stomatin/prohibitin superfamily)